MITEGNVPLHPVLKCLCLEGRILENGEVKYLPGVHDCSYIRERNERLHLTKKAVPSAAPATHAS